MSNFINYLYFYFLGAAASNVDEKTFRSLLKIAFKRINFEQLKGECERKFQLENKNLIYDRRSLQRNITTCWLQD